MKKNLILAAVLVAILMACNMNPSDPINVTSVSIDTVVGQLSLGDTRALSATVLPADADDITLIWTSSDDTVATVNSNGLVTPIKPGIVIITSTSRDDDRMVDSEKLYIGYEDSFDDRSMDIITSDSYDFSIKDGKYVVSVINKLNTRYSLYAKYPFAVDGSTKISLDMPYSLSFDSSFVSETDETFTTAYVRFNDVTKSDTDYYYDYLLISSSGRVKLQHFDKILYDKPDVSGYYNYMALEWTAQDSVNIDSTENHVVIEQGSDSFTVLINGDEVGTFINRETPFESPSEFQFGNYQSRTEVAESVTFEITTSYDNFEIFPID